MRSLLSIMMVIASILFPLFGFAQPKGSLHDYSATGLDGKPVDFSKFKGKKLLIVNTASECGLTPQYSELESLYKEYSGKGLEIIGFPSNDFAGQEPGTNKEIAAFCQKNYGVTFTMMEKINVKGDSMHPVYKYLTSKKLNGVKSSKVKWNFQKYLVDEDGHLVDVVSPWKKPACKRILSWLN